MSNPTTIDLSRRDGESHTAHLERVAHMHQLPGRGQTRSEAKSSPVVGIESLPMEERAALETETAGKREEALSRLSQRRRHGDR